MTITFLRRLGPPLLGGAVALSLTPAANATEELRIGFVAPTTGIFDQGYKKIAAIGADYAFGYEVIGGFQRAFEACGGQIIQKIWPPLGTKDFGPYIPTIRQDADAIFTLMVGPMSLQFPKQLAAAGNKKPVIGGGTSYDEFVLPSMGDEVIGHISTLQYSAALETPKNQEFVKKYRAKYGKVPSYYSE